MYSMYCDGNDGAKKSGRHGPRWHGIVANGLLMNIKSMSMNLNQMVQWPYTRAMVAACGIAARAPCPRARPSLPSGRLPQVLLMNERAWHGKKRRRFTDYMQCVCIVYCLYVCGVVLTNTRINCIYMYMLCRNMLYVARNFFIFAV